MAIDRQGTGLTVLRICLSVFFLPGLGKIRWLDTSPLAGCSRAGRRAARVDQPLVSGTDRGPRCSDFREARSTRRDDERSRALLGIWTPLFALIAFFMR
jgi:hypothetical protein